MLRFSVMGAIILLLPASACTTAGPALPTSAIPAAVAAATETPPATETPAPTETTAPTVTPTIPAEPTEEATVEPTVVPPTPEPTEAPPTATPEIIASPIDRLVEAATITP